MVGMARQNKAQRDKNTTDRMTPCDVKVKGTFAEKPKAEKAPPRPPTASETRGNNMGSVELGRMLGTIYQLAMMFAAELREVNRGKRGAPYLFSDSLIAWMGNFQAAFNADVRTVAGFTEGLLEFIGVASPSYSRYCERANEAYDRLRRRVPEELRERYGGEVLLVRGGGRILKTARNVGIDSTGLSLSATSGWRKHKWKTDVKDRGWLKLHALCDVDSGEILAYVVTTEKVGDVAVLKTLIDTATEYGHRMGTVYADGAYSSVENFEYVCGERKLRFVTSFKVNTSPKSHGCEARGEAAKLWCELPYDEWVKVTGYGRRWKCECVFSDLKRRFDEYVAARTEEGMSRYVAEKVAAHNLAKSLRAEIIGVTGIGVAIA